MRKHNQNKGLTLPEVLISASILGYCLSMILMCYLNALNLNESSRNLIAALSHAEYVLEDMRNVPGVMLRLKVANQEWEWDGAKITEKGLNALRDETISVSVGEGTPFPVMVRVKWKDRNGRQRQQDINTMFLG